MEDFIPTRASKLNENLVKEFASVTYEAPKKKSKKEESKSSNDNNEVNASTDNGDKLYNKKNNTTLDRRKQQELEMKRARYDVIKFGISGFESSKAKEAKVQLAIKLGAKPPKNPSLNYKVLKDIRKKEAEEKDKEPMSGLSKSLIKHKNKSKNKLKKNSGILEQYGKVNKDAFVKNKK